MRLFKRGDDEGLCCPECRERVVEGATECAMCGHRFPTGETEERFSRETETAAEEAPR